MTEQNVNLIIGGYPFLCSPLAAADVTDVAPAIYVILCVGHDGESTVLDAIERSEPGERIDTNDRKACWQNYCSSGEVWVCIYQMPTTLYTAEDRRNAERNIRDAYGPLPCGVDM